MLNKRQYLMYYDGFCLREYVGLLRVDDTHNFSCT